MDAATKNISLVSLDFAITQLGQREVPARSNKGPMVNEYLKSVGLKPGYAWCQAFVYWCVLQAARQLGLHCPAVRTAGVKDCWNRTPAERKILIAAARANHELVSPGDQVILIFKDGAHTCFVERIEGEVIHTVEGNSNTNGSRDGELVCRHERHFSDPTIVGFIKYS